MEGKPLRFSKEENRLNMKTVNRGKNRKKITVIEVAKRRKLLKEGSCRKKEVAERRKLLKEGNC